MPIVDRSIDPLTGLVTDIGFEDGKMKIRYSQDASALHEQNQKLRQEDEYTRMGIKKGWMHAVSMSAADCLKMLVEDGVDPYKVSAKELNRHVQRNKEKWGHCLVTKVRV